MWKNRSFAFRLNSVICLLSLLGILSVIFIDDLLSRRALEGEMRNHTMPALVNSIESDITQSLSIAHSSLQYLSRWPFLVNWIEKGEQPDDFHEIIRLCDLFVDVFKTGHINITIDATRHFYEGVDLSPHAVKILDPVVDKWFDEFKAGGKKIYTNLHAPGDPEYGGKAYVNARVEDGRGRFLGIVSAPFDLSTIEETLRTKRIGRLGRTFIATLDGTVLLHPDPAYIHKSVRELPAFANVQDQVFRDPETFFRVKDPQGRPLLVGSRSLDVMEAVIFTVADEQEFFRVIDRARNYSLAAAFVVLGVIIFAGLRLSGYLAYSMQKVVDFAGKVAANEASEPFDHADSKEMRVLADALNDMNRQLRLSNLSLETVSKIFDGLDVGLMVVDPETDEILFNNARLKKDSGLSDDLCGRKCWQVMYADKEERCEECPTEHLEIRPDAILRRQVRNFFNNRLYEEVNSLIDWTGGKKAMLVQRVDVHDSIAAKEALRLRLAQLELALSISQSLFSREPIANLITSTIQKTGEFTGLDRLRVSRYDQEKSALVCDYEWLNPRQAAPSMLGAVVPLDEDHPLYSRYITDKEASVAVSDISSIPELRVLPSMGVKAFINTPIYVSGELWGIIGADDCQAPHQWTSADTNLLRLVAGLLSGLLSRRSAEANLHRMTLLVEQATQYITYVNTDGSFQYFNGSTCTLLGYSPEELSAGGLQLIFSEKNWATVHETLLPEIVRKGRLSFELPVVRKDGVRRIFSFEAFAIGSGDDVGIGAIGLDRTEKRALQDELLAAKEAAEHSSRAKSAFLSRMSHEMRTPLNAVIGMAGIALNADQQERTRDCLKKINDAATVLLGMINEVLDMSNIEANTFELHKGEFSFEALVGKTTDAFRLRAEKKNLRFTVSLDPKIPHFLFADERRLGQVIAILLDNAVKFTPENGSIGLCATLLEDMDRECVLEIAISDSGLGIPADKIKTLFTLFEQVDGGDSRKFGGAGLGLALSRKILDLVGGSIGVVSERGKGSVFTITVRVDKGIGQPEAVGEAPRESAPESGSSAWRDEPGAEEAPGSREDVPASFTTEPAAASVSTEMPEEGGTALADAQAMPSSEGAFSGRRVLLAEDVEINREIVMALLESTGLEIDCAENGKEAVDMFVRDPARYQLIFMDINMPEVNGYEAAVAIRASGVDQASTVPIIAMTANAFSEDIQKCLAAGMNGHLAKPIMVDKMMAVLHEYLGDGSHEG